MSISLEHRSVQAVPESGVGVDTLLMDIGLNPEQLTSGIHERLTLLDNETRIVDDARKMLVIAEDVFAYCDNNSAKCVSFNDEERRAIRMGVVLSDIGKSGSVHATALEQQAIVAIYSVDNIGDPRQITMQDFVKKYLTVIASKIGSETNATTVLTLLQDCDSRIVPGMTMRQFFNLHAEWTASLLQDERIIPDEAVDACARHHILEGVNVNSVSLERPLTRADKFVIVLDKYNALRSRGGKEHAEAITLLREKYIRTSAKYGDDVEFESLLKLVDGALAG